ncbi:hypothetical protein CCACVL1_22389 [Corchorus capsularis]|uniref:Uncharacterized protein n=1 Tax=Corchorus capsularis TaxID=210143 RepID=A0A1R3GZT2_COCAP|nr:hypothetical protein CCACVL1_22389 [Corchorus capsularis]
MDRRDQQFSVGLVRPTEQSKSKIIEPERDKAIYLNFNAKSN